MAREASSPGVIVSAKRWTVLDRRETIADAAGARRGSVDGDDQRGGNRVAFVDADLGKRGVQRGLCRAVGLGDFSNALVIGAELAGDAVGALDVAAEPEEIIRGAAGEQGTELGVDGVAVGGEQRDALDRFVGDDPDVGGAATGLHGDGGSVG
jgi:hypothetical protein